MKKIIITVLLAAFAAGFAFSQNGVIRDFTGSVELKQAGSSVFVPATVGASVAPNTVISTGFRSTAVIVIGGSTVTVNPLTRLTLAEIQSTANTETINVNLQSGRVRVEVNPPAGARANFTLQTPSSTASVRGTVFEMNADKVSVSEGKVMFSGSGKMAVIVTGGNSTRSNTNGVPSDPVEVAAASLAPNAPAVASSQTRRRIRSSEISVGLEPDWQ